MAMKSTTVEKLLDSSRDKVLGNHRIQSRGIRDVYRSIFYFYTEIVRIWDDKKEFWVDSSYGTVSTTQACSVYRRVLLDRGYTEIDK